MRSTRQAVWGCTFTLSHAAGSCTIDCVTSTFLPFFFGAAAQQRCSYTNVEDGCKVVLSQKGLIYSRTKQANEAHQKGAASASLLRASPMLAVSRSHTLSSGQLRYLRLPAVCLCPWLCCCSLSMYLRWYHTHRVSLRRPRLLQGPLATCWPQHRNCR